MERLERMKEILMCAVEKQLENLNEVNTKELGEVIDMIKDLSKTIYYCSITKEMEEEQYESGKKDKHHNSKRESKESYHDKKDLEKYIEEISEMIDNTSPEERQILNQKLNMLIAKIN